MEKKNNRSLFIFSIVIGVLTSIGYMFDDFLFHEFWLIAGVVVLVLSIWLIVNIVKSIIRNDKRLIILNLAFVLLIIIINVGRTEFFKSNKVLEATLVDDLSAISLILRENHSFEVTPTTLFGDSKPYVGKYEIVNKQIIFLSRPYSNDFLPDTILIYRDKLILNGSIENPDTSFANYFRVDVNKIELKTLANKK